MRKMLFCILLGAFLIGGLTVSSLAAPQAFAASHTSASIPGCVDSDYSCGYLDGFSAATSEVGNGLCYGSEVYFSAASYNMTASERGFQDAFIHYCHT